ncbi:MAG TPA: thiamine phosphate synthase [Labilithrix sp.]|jgi:thiamine-phosphate pyrophosphorylase|nr:thiamine phosphate synthase [Labilithrix sp.]
MTSASLPRRLPSVTLITDPRYRRGHVERTIELASAGLAAGALAVQLRDKQADLETLACTARALRAVTARCGALFLVNAPTREVLDLATEVGADGAHVPCGPSELEAARRAFGPSGWISTPAHTDDDVTTAARAGATSVLVSPIFDTPGKGVPRGLEALTAARSRGNHLVVVALGGVDPSRVTACAESGAHGVAVIRALLDAPDRAATARALGEPFR